MRIEATLQASVSDQYSLSAGTGEEITVEPALAYIKEEIVSEEYDGAYEFTPTNETQVIPIQFKTASRDITINPIPNNYGLITWNGEYLTVS